MKKKTLSAILVLLCMLLCLFAGCAQKEASDTQAPEIQPTSGITLTDMIGRTVTLKEPATRIVALAPAECEILYALGAGDLLVGRGEYCDYPAEVLDVPAVNSGYETNIEQLIALQPQVLLMSSMANQDEFAKTLEAAGIQVLVIDADDIAGVYTAIELIGTLVGKSEEALALTNAMESTFAEISENATGDGSETIYFEVSPLQYGLWTAGADSFMNEIALMLGVRNCFEDVSGWAEISEEQVLERNPDYIVTVGMYFGEGPTPTEEILGRAGWENVNAVRNGKVLNLQNNELSRPAPRLAEGARMLYDFIYGA